jgi:hypothetical protein
VRHETSESRRTYRLCRPRQGLSRPVKVVPSGVPSNVETSVVVITASTGWPYCVRLAERQACGLPLFLSQGPPWSPGSKAGRRAVARSAMRSTLEAGGAAPAVGLRSHSGSHRWQIPSDTGRHAQTIRPAQCLAERCRATCRDASLVPSNQRVAVDFFGRCSRKTYLHIVRAGAGCWVVFDDGQLVVQAARVVR